MAMRDCEAVVASHAAFKPAEGGSDRGLPRWKEQN